jgi:hypothetical protein
MLAVLVMCCLAFVIASCKGSGGGEELTLAVSRVEGDASNRLLVTMNLSGIHINIAEFPYDNLFEKN